MAGGRGEILAGGMVYIDDQVFSFTNETTHFQTGHEQAEILHFVLRRLQVDYRLLFPLAGRKPDLFAEIDAGADSGSPPAQNAEGG